MTENRPEGKSQICVDVDLSDNEKDSKKHKGILSRVASRAIQGKGTKLRGGEVTTLKNTVQERIDGEILGVDGLTQTGVNIAARVTKEERDRIKNDPKFKIHAELDNEK